MKFPSLSLVALAASILSPVAVVAQSDFVYTLDGQDVSIPVSSAVSYDSGQDQHKRRPLIVSADGRTVTLEGNIHRALPFLPALSIKANTVMDVDVTIGSIQEAQAICLEENTGHSSSRCYVFAHTQDLSSSWHILDPQTAEGETKHYTIPIGHYFWGDNKFNYLALMQDNDSSNRDAGSVTFSNIAISNGAEFYMTQNGLSHYTNTAAQIRYKGSQDSWQYPLMVSEDGKSVQLQGNMWRAIPIETPIVIDAATDLEFTVTIADVTEIHSICFADSTNGGLSARDADRCINVGGTQSFGYYNVDPHTQEGETRTYTIPIGLVYQGVFRGNIDYIMFIHDNDSSDRSTGDSTWSNIAFTQSVRPSFNIMVNGEAQEISSATQATARNDQDSRLHFLDISDANSVTMKGNVHKALTISEPFEINKATELDFDFTLTTMAEHHTICIVTDPTNIASYTWGNRCWTVAWTQNVSWDHNIEPQTAVGETRHYNIPIGLKHPGGQAYYLVFVQDSDADKTLGESTFSNIEFSQRPDLMLDINGVETGVFNHQLSYGSRQDFASNLIEVSDDGKKASMYGNLWKALELPTPVTITDNTVLSFTVDIEELLEFVSICFDEDLSDQKQARCFKLSGTQTTNLGTVIYKGIKQTYEGETKEYMIRLKEFYTGDAFNYIVFQHDNDGAARHDGISHISDISLYEMEPSCLEGATFNFDLSECTVDNFIAALQTKMTTIGACAGKDAWREMLSLIDGQSDSDVRDRIEGICAAAYTSETVEFDTLLDKEKQFVEEFFDGGNKWNYEVDEAAGPNLAKDASRITIATQKFDGNHAIAFPDVHNFEGCELRAAMCCYVAARDVDYEPEDNSDACYMDFSKSRQSSHVRDGYSIYGDGSEGNFACHGFAWGNDSGYNDAAFKGNTLFDVAMKNELYTNKKVEELPGAPMCGCIENMPVVTRADCTTTTVTQTVSISFDSIEFFAESTVTNVQHTDCADLTTHYAQLVDEGKATSTELQKLKKHVVGDGMCGAALYDFLDSKGFVYTPHLAASSST
eukprot:CAMPEP_0178938414 /NCGR_PEP_ID=MMETSP0786-20121207/26315_1 /TAXON_ID=186022 /ORGANISM="Thalassionema frauenfeldii, Strain CCMP 1798" /LENGTH=1040 /DNA_ID=CAMNT_0020617125 /DNA_START=57 /DNA_END=3179 /DNA_ORIENTATION=-